MQEKTHHYEICNNTTALNSFYSPAAAPEDRGWGSSTLCEPHQPAETGGKLTMLIRFMGNLPHVLLILETFKRADHRGDREDDRGSNIGERKWTE